MPKVQKPIYKLTMGKLKKDQEIYVIKLYEKLEIIKCKIIKLGRLYFNVDKLQASFEIKTGMDKHSTCGYSHSYIFFTSEKEADNYILKKVFLQNIKNFKDFDSLSIMNLRIINDCIRLTT